MIATDGLYPIRRPLAAACAGAVVAILGGLVGLGSAEFRLPILIAIFALYPHRATASTSQSALSLWPCRQFRD